MAHPLRSVIARTMRIVPLLAFLGCAPVAPPSAPPPKPAGVVSAPGPGGLSVREVGPAELTAQVVLDELRMQVFAYEIKAPANHRATFSIEVWKDGKLDPNLCEAYWMQAPRDRPLKAMERISFWDGEGINSKQSRWSHREEMFFEESTSGSSGKSSSRGTSMSSGVRWVDDPLKAKGIRSRMSSKNELGTALEPGREYLLYMTAGNRGDSIKFGSLGTETSEQTAKGFDVVVFLKLRVDPVPADRQGEGASFSTTSGTPGAPSP